MAYGLKYTCDFDNNLTSYTLEISQKDYIGSVIALTGSSNPVTHTWETDDPKAAIKGSSIAISLVNEGTIPLTDLYSVNDEEFKTILLWHTGGGDITLFEGFIVQDDCIELMADYNHEITLSANDNLGLLKDVPFDQALLQKIPIGHSVTILSSGFAIDMPLTLLVGDKFDITDATTNYGTYTVATVVDADSYTTTTTMPFLSGSYTIVLQEVLPFYDLISLLKVVQLCLLGTGIALDTRVFANINESSEINSVCFFEQTLIDPQTFNTGSSFEDCYQVLTKVLERFNCTLFQAKGYWNIVRWDEARYYDYAIPGFVYDTSFALQPAQALDSSSLVFGGFPKYLFGIGEDSVAETGLMQRINRPLKFTKETFNYKKPAQILRNYDLSTLGDLFNTVTTGMIKREYYDFPVSSGWQHIASDNSYIVVETDTVTGNEIQRYVEQQVINSSYPPGSAAPVTSLEFNDIEVGYGDQWDLSFSYRWKSNSGDYGLLNVAIFVLDTATDYYNLNDAVLTPGTHVGWGHVSGTYTDGFGNRVSTLILQSEDKTEWRQFSISGLITDPAFKMVNTPIDGVMKIYVYGSNSRTGGQQSGYTNVDFEFKDIHFDYTPLINQSTKIIGQIHTSNQSETIKNANEREISLDNSPRNSIQGTLFLDSLTGLLQTRCGQWKRSYASGDKNLGEITTFENLFLRRLPRTLLEGTFYGLLSGGNHLSPLSVCRYTFFTDRNFIFGRLEIDYRNNSASGTLYEMYKDSETDGDLSYYYTFQFLYASK